MATATAHQPTPHRTMPVRRVRFAYPTGQQRQHFVSGDLVQSNRIGTDITGKNPLGNGGNGVHLTGSAIAVGGGGASAGNIIAFNANDGVFVESGQNNSISHNSIFANGNLGIELDAANSANGSLPAPVLTSAVSSGGFTLLQGTLTTGVAFTTYTIEFYVNPASAPSPAEGETFLASFTVTTDGSGAASFALGLPRSLSSGVQITATTTFSPRFPPGVAETSEFSNSVAVTP